MPICYLQDRIVFISRKNISQNGRNDNNALNEHYLGQYLFSNKKIEINNMVITKGPMWIKNQVGNCIIIDVFNNNTLYKCYSYGDVIDDNRQRIYHIYYLFKYTDQTNTLLQKYYYSKKLEKKVHHIDVFNTPPHQEEKGISQNNTHHYKFYESNEKLLAEYSQREYY